MIRHGKTAGNLEKRYVGRTDESLSELGIEEASARKETLFLEGIEAVFVSPKRRCLETASILFGKSEQIVIENLRECDFGDFEMKNWQDLEGNEDYQKFIDSNGMLPFPNGEGMLSFQARCMKGFEEVLLYCQNHGIKEHIVMVVHGGTIMSVCSYLMDEIEEYFKYSCDNVGGYVIMLEGENVTCIQRLA